MTVRVSWLQTPMSGREIVKSMTGDLVRQERKWRDIDRLCDHTYVPTCLGPNSTVLDLGANKGEFSHGMISRYQCRVYAVEPLSSLRKEIVQSPRLSLVPFAVGGRNERSQLHVFGTRCASMLRRLDEEATESEEIVDVLDFKSLLGHLNLDRIDLVKIDIEGAELEMFASASDADLARCTQITVEFHDFIYPEQGPQVESIKRRMRALGFWVINFSLDNTDVLFLNAATSRTGRLKYLGLKYISKYIHGISRRVRAWQNTSSASKRVGIQKG
jgi:FkbM family methyltransferase